MNGNSTFLMGVNNEDVDKAIDIIKNNSKKRVQNVPLDMNYKERLCPACRNRYCRRSYGICSECGRIAGICNDKFQRI